MSYNVQKNGNIHVGKEMHGQTITAKMHGYNAVVWSRVRSNGVANVGRKWAGFECELQVEVPALLYS